MPSEVSTSQLIWMQISWAQLTLKSVMRYQKQRTPSSVHMRVVSTSIKVYATQMSTSSPPRRMRLSSSGVRHQLHREMISLTQSQGERVQMQVKEEALLGCRTQLNKHQFLKYKTRSRSPHVTSFQHQIQSIYRILLGFRKKHRDSSVRELVPPANQRVRIPSG